MIERNEKYKIKDENSNTSYGLFGVYINTTIKT